MLKVYKFILLFMCILFQNPAFAVDACVPNDTVAVVLDASKNIDSYGASSSSTFYAGQFRGISACLSSRYEREQKEFYTDNDGVLVDNNAVVIGGEQNASPEGYSFCWCKITYPIVSFWFLRDWIYTYPLSHCVSACADGCGYVVWQYGDLLRKPLFNSLRN